MIAEHEKDDMNLLQYMKFKKHVAIRQCLHCHTTCLVNGVAALRRPYDVIANYVSRCNTEHHQSFQ
jgi:hypothetical protein